MRLQLAFLTICLGALVNGQATGTDGIVTVASPTCTTTGSQISAAYDASGFYYQYICGNAASGALLTQINSVSNWQSCFSYCDNYVATLNSYAGSSGFNCSGFIFVGAYQIIVDFKKN
jgi:hypothetical protein